MHTNLELLNLTGDYQYEMSLSLKVPLDVCYVHFTILLLQFFKISIFPDF